MGALKTFVEATLRDVGGALLRFADIIAKKFGRFCHCAPRSLQQIAYTSQLRRPLVCTGRVLWFLISRR